MTDSSKRISALLLNNSIVQCFIICLRAVCKIIIGNGIAIEEIWTNVIYFLAEGGTAIIMKIHSHYVFIIINNVPVKSTRSLSTLNGLCLSLLIIISHKGPVLITCNYIKILYIQITCEMFLCYQKCCSYLLFYLCSV